ALFMRCSLWREAAENVAESLTKGCRVIVSGRLKQRSYDDRDGNRRTVVELDVEEIGPSLRYALAKPVRAARGGQSQQSSQQRPPQQDDPWGSAPASDFGGAQQDPPF
ncbi:single-stranded DNA-binding protein, partial [Tsukamurella ocularis]